MKINRSVCILAGILLLGNGQLALSQGQSKTADRDQTMDKTQAMDRNQTMDRDQTMDKDRDMDRDQQQVQDKDRVHQSTDSNIYGAQLMTEQEQNRYRKSLDNAGTEQERKRIEEQHQQQMQERARKQNVELPAVE